MKKLLLGIVFFNFNASSMDLLLEDSVFQRTEKELIRFLKLYDPYETKEEAISKKNRYPKKEPNYSFYEKYKKIKSLLKKLCSCSSNQE